MDVSSNAKKLVMLAGDNSGLENTVEDSLNSLTTGLAMRSKTLPPPPEWAIAQALGLDKVSTSWLAGDGSDRCYYRIQAGERTFVLMQLSGDDAVQLQRDGYEWVKIGRLLHDHGIFAPQTVATLPDFAALIIEDYGDLMMETRALSGLENNDRANVMALYRQSFNILARFLQITEKGQSNWTDRSFDAARLDWELHFFQEQFLKGVLGWTLSPAEQKSFDQGSKRLAEQLASKSNFFVHRDFHSRNVMVTNNKLAVIDFQDARLGPATYDLVSICFDSYIPLKADERRTLVNEGCDYLVDQVAGLSLEQLHEEWRPMLLQRQLKALGSFGYLTTQKNRGNYLKYVSAALETLVPENVANGKWNFLSTDMIEGIRNRWKTP
ncbi:MAG: phosphotransferase [Chitinophagaceae bacterium]|nr:phosphotransferase [Oligoflexus sp.]